MLRDYQGHRCYQCGHLLAPQGDLLAPDAEMQSIDHVIPRSKGGANRLGNVALAHKKCNNEKADRMPYACELMFAREMARCFEDSHIAEPYQGFGIIKIRHAARSRIPTDFRLHIRGKNYMYVRSPEGGKVMSRAQYRSELKRLALEKRSGPVAEVA